MADLPPDSNRDTSTALNRESPPSTPGWVKVFGIIALILVLLVVLILFTGIGGEHGPGRHIRTGTGVSTPSGSPGGSTPTLEEGVQQP